MTLSLSNLLTPKVVHSFNHLATQIYYVSVQLEQLPTMFLLESIGYDFSLAWTFCVHATIIQSNQGDISFMSVRDLMGIGTLEEIH